MSSLKEAVSGLPREFWWLWASTLINRLGGFVTTFLSLYLTAGQGYSASYAGLVAAMYGLGGAVSAVVAGVLADRFGRRPTLLVSQLATAAAMATLGLMQHPVAIVVVATILGLTANASRPCIQAVIADLVPPADQVRAFSLNYWAINIGFAAASATAGFIAESGYLFLFFGNAASVLVCALLIYLKVPETRPDDASARVGGGGDKAVGARAGRPSTGLGEVLRDGKFMVAVGLAFLLAMVLMQYTTSLPVSMGRNGFSSADYGLVISMNGLMVVVATIPLTRAIKHRNPVHVLVVAALLSGYGFGLTAFADSVPLYVATVCIWTVGEILNSPTSMALVASLSPAHARGRYQGMHTFAWSAATFAGPLLGGLIIDHLGDRSLWLACAALGTVVAVGYYLLRGTLNATRHPPVAPVVAAERELAHDHQG
ncbi:MDR family MFS transporter [Micromonospora sp. CPCC 205561]|uniref:MDR family MFS transporter n=1 Tax=Micromonospora sp. CPCC 205561 TaxID=3122407 RepID=UPI002FF2CE14